ncbi:hypothetical protein EDE08_10418 [Bradyrhizobium sp. R2.2-H]|nr:hypothetical protein EDE10_104624 [Bradyrhizobium sp. Y-H1]TCU75856.1 hypothetical protein EDE08_10418 [Bradyrhizobium sp. R2.2-H]
MAQPDAERLPQADGFNDLLNGNRHSAAPEYIRHLRPGFGKHQVRCNVDAPLIVEVQLGGKRAAFDQSNLSQQLKCLDRSINYRKLGEDKFGKLLTISFDHWLPARVSVGEQCVQER